MAASMRATANDILNRVAAEVGLEPVSSPYESSKQEFRQMTYLLNICGEELCQLYPWEALVREHRIITQAGDTGDYDLPSDFLYMLNQTGWEYTGSTPLGGPLSAQQWQYLRAQDFDVGTIYASFRIQQAQFTVTPHPPPAGLDIRFEYLSKNWVEDSSTTDSYIDRVKNGGDRPVFDRTLLSRMLKVKFLEAKGLDASKAQADTNQMFQMLTSHDKAAPKLAAGRRGVEFPYLGPCSVPFTGFGS